MPMGEGGEAMKSFSKETLEKHGGNKRKLRAAQDAIRTHNEGVNARRKKKKKALERAAKQARPSGGLRVKKTG